MYTVFCRYVFSCFIAKFLFAVVVWLLTAFFNFLPVSVLPVLQNIWLLHKNSRWIRSYSAVFKLFNQNIHQEYQDKILVSYLKDKHWNQVLNWIAPVCWDMVMDPGYLRMSRKRRFQEKSLIAQITRDLRKCYTFGSGPSESVDHLYWEMVLPWNFKKPHPI